ncbi:MAG: alpha/beta hydrolase, partial [Gammaproteobacteria bacterium]|nr:alpha/beta hydrolase [Gammaproteobacteria bacterium]
AGTIRHLRGDHVVYALTLAGFDGLPAPKEETGLLDQAAASLLKLIEDRNIDHPVLVGHSIGGTLAIRFAGEHNDLLSGVVAVDGLPVFPGAQDLTPEQRKARAKIFKARMAAMTPAQFKAQQSMYMKRVGVIDPAMAKCYARLTGKSGPVATGEYAANDYASDYRPGLKNITVPLLEIAPYYAPDARQTAARTGSPVRTAQDKADFYASLLANDPQAEVVTISPARHFVMLDQPQKFLHVLDNFLSRLPEVKSHD